MRDELNDLLWKHRATNLLNKEARINVTTDILAIFQKLVESKRVKRFGGREFISKDDLLSEIKIRRIYD